MLSLHGGIPSDVVKNADGAGLNFLADAGTLPELDTCAFYG
jgi:hypothetical protein